MTKEEFDNQRWEAGMSCYVDGDLYPIVKVDLGDRLVGVLDEEDGSILEVPCKFVHAVNPANP